MLKGNCCSLFRLTNSDCLNSNLSDCIVRVTLKRSEGNIRYGNYKYQLQCGELRPSCVSILSIDIIFSF